jgi:Tol biopolymer transport system component
MAVQGCAGVRTKIWKSDAGVLMGGDKCWCVRCRCLRMILVVCGSAFLCSLVTWSLWPCGGRAADDGQPACYLPLVMTSETMPPRKGYLPLVMGFVPTPTPAGGGRIAFESGRIGEGRYEIYTMNSDGSGLVRVTWLRQYSRDASWSPDYSRIVFDSGPVGAEQEREIYIINANGSGLVRLTNNGVKDWDPSWSPDGSRIAFTSRLEGNWDIYSMNTSGYGRVNLTHRSGPDLDPCWSPDGKKIAFCSEYGGDDYEIWIMDADGSSMTQLTHNSRDDTDPSWSPDGTRIAFECTLSGNTEICVMNVDGSGERNLTNNSANDVDPSWMNGTERLVFGSYRTGNGEVFIMNGDGSGVPQQLTHHAGADGDACARPGCP